MPPVVGQNAPRIQPRGNCVHGHYATVFEEGILFGGHVVRVAFYRGVIMSSIQGALCPFPDTAANVPHHAHIDYER